MNTFKGPFRLIIKEMNVTFYINLVVTLALMGLYIFLSFYLAENDMLGVTFGPFYAIFFVYPFIVFKGYKYILSLGGTRKQFMFATYLSIGIYIVLSGIILNGLHYLSPYLLNEGYIFHMADLVNGSHPLLYIWIDILWMIILFGVGVIAQSIYFNLGTVRTLSGVAALLIAILATVFFADFSPLIEFIITDHFLFIHILGGISVLFMLFSYHFMKNGPLERGDRHLFSGKWKQPKPE